MMEPDAAISTRSRTFGMLAIVDTRTIKQHSVPGPTRSAPTVIGSEHVFVVGSGLRPKGGTLTLHARPGDIVSLAGTSADRNSSDAVIVYSVQPISQHGVFSPFKQRLVTRSGAAEPDPDSASRDGLPALETTACFSSFESDVWAHGKATIRVEFALYALGRNGQAQILAGYYTCGLAITVALP